MQEPKKKISSPNSKDTTVSEDSDEENIVYFIGDGIALDNDDVADMKGFNKDDIPIGIPLDQDSLQRIEE